MRSLTQKGWPTLAAATIAAGMTALPTTALGVAIPALQADLDASLSELQWTLTAYSLAYSSLLIASGRLSDIFGHRRFVLAGTGVFALGSVSAALAGSPIMLILSLGLIGVGGAMLVPASLSLITHAFSGRPRTRAIALWGAASGFVSGLGPPIGGVLTAEFSWRWIFWLLLLLGAGIVALTLTGVTESKNEEAERTIDYGGVVFLAGAIGLLSLGLIEGSGRWGWSALPTIVSLSLSALLLSAFLVLEKRVRNPLVRFAVMRHRNFAGGLVVRFAVNFMLASLLFMLPIYLEEILGYSPVKAGVLLLPLSATFLTSLPVSTYLMNRVGPRVPVLSGLVLAAVGVWFIAGIGNTTRYVDILPAMAVLGLGVGLASPAMNTAAVNAVPSRDHGEATGILTTLVGLGSVLGVAVTGAAFKHVEDSRLDHAFRLHGHPLPNGTERELEGALAHAPDSLRELAKYPVNVQDDIVRALREAFVFGISHALEISFGVALLGIVLCLIVLRGGRPAEEPLTPPVIGPA
jgi:EmrB/QacA subfamily drug resistance transporter